MHTCIRFIRVEVSMTSCNQGFHSVVNFPLWNCQGVGKTMILGTFAEILGYRRITVFCFKDWEVDFVLPS